MSRPRGGRFCGTCGRRRVWAALPVLYPAGPAALPSQPLVPSAAFHGVTELLLLLCRQALCSVICPGCGGRRPWECSHPGLQRGSRGVRQVGEEGHQRGV